jgi:hypothetical protein
LVLALDWKQRLPPGMCSSVSAPNWVKTTIAGIFCTRTVQQGLCCVWMRNRTLFHSTGGSWNTMLPMMNQEPEGMSRLENKSTGPDPFTLPSCHALTHASQYTVAAMAPVLARNLFACKRTRREPLDTNDVSSIICVSNGLSLMATNKAGFSFRTGRIPYSQHFREGSA